LVLRRSGSKKMEVPNLPRERNLHEQGKGSGAGLLPGGGLRASRPGAVRPVEAGAGVADRTSQARGVAGGGGVCGGWGESRELLPVAVPVEEGRRQGPHGR